ncbi:Uncharacterised protein [Mycobacteroides abscessus]|nr:Uncharacterised protein [Mycobacteroides abscessus]
MAGAPNGVGGSQIGGADDDGHPLVHRGDRGVDDGIEFALLEIGGLTGAAQGSDGMRPILDQPGHKFGEPIGVDGVIGEEWGDRVGDDSVKLWCGGH